MSLAGDYDGNNIFAKILRDEAPCVKIFENDDCPLYKFDASDQKKGEKRGCRSKHEKKTRRR